MTRTWLAALTAALLAGTAAARAASSSTPPPRPTWPPTPAATVTATATPVPPAHTIVPAPAAAPGGCSTCGPCASCSSCGCIGPRGGCWEQLREWLCYQPLIHCYNCGGCCCDGYHCFPPLYEYFLYHGRCFEGPGATACVSAGSCGGCGLRGKLGMGCGSCGGRSWFRLPACLGGCDH